MAINTSTSQTSLQAFDGGGEHYISGYPHTTDHDYDPGVLVLPVASSTSKTVKVRVHGGYSTRRVRFNVQRNNNPPIIPKPEDIVGRTKTDVLVSCSISTPLPTETTSAGGLSWQVAGEYLFVSTGTATTDVAARKPGTDMLPLGGYPYGLGVADTIASAVYPGTDGNLTAYSLSQIPLVSNDNHVWPFTILPPFVFNANLLKE